MIEILKFIRYDIWFKTSSIKYFFILLHIFAFDLSFFAKSSVFLEIIKKKFINTKFPKIIQHLKKVFSLTVNTINLIAEKFYTLGILLMGLNNIKNVRIFFTLRLQVREKDDVNQSSKNTF